MKNKFKPMTLSQKQKLFASAGLPMVALILILGFQNCSPGVVISSKLASTGETFTPTARLNLDEDTKPVTVAHSENVLVSLQMLTGVRTLSTRTLNTVSSAQAKITETGRADSVNAPMWLAVTNLAGEVCLDLIDEERAKAAGERRFFGQVDFAAGPASLSQNVRNDAIRRMARNFWGRNETAAERTVINMSMEQILELPRRTNANEVTDTQDVVLFMCTSMLSSLDAIKF
ncbi:MAG: hypothetical protein RBT63_04220 [Bdellovibrionales bacterium]|jgi:hypothetical protein|nr:hypothetical protein [Bdellovibrionales bacterium]